MEKLVYLAWQRDDVSGAELRDGLIGQAKPLRDLGATQLAVNVHDEDVAQGEGVRIRRLDPPIRAMLSFWLENADDRAPCERLLHEQSARLAGYLVVESVPQPNATHTAPPGERTPGANMVTCINRLAGLSDDEFIHRWHDEHKVVALETQSTFSYVRNVVVRALTPEAPHFDGIVEEGFPLEALTDPKAWYAAGDSQELYEQRLRRMIESVRSFLDLDALESHPMSQYVL